MNFEEAIKLNDLGPMIERQYSRWGSFTEEAAKLIVTVSRLESIAPELLAVTWMNESTFGLNPPPNVNKNPANLFGYDVGPLQLNMGWTYKSVWVGEFSAKGLHFKDVFGVTFADGIRFDGDPVANLRMGARKLLSIKGDNETRAVKYTGPGAQPHRLRDWQKYGWRFQAFFQAYTATSDNKVSATSTALQPSDTATDASSGRAALSGPPKSKGVV